MQTASENMEFERAGQIRDLLKALELLTGTQTRAVENFKRVSDHAEAEAVELAQVLGLDQPPQRIEAFDISNFQGQQAVGSMVHFFCGRPDKRFYRRFKIREVTGINDFAMMREVVKRRYQRLIEEKGIFPDLILIDGGKGQLSSAKEVLDQLGLSHIPVIGLAKRYEQIVTPHSTKLISLKFDSGALHLVQRIRDEAHRFAVTYHKMLRDVKIRESILDDIPGIGPRKKECLIKAFDSFRALSKASLEKIKKVAGISQDLAARIYDLLHN